jgi:hypothetical protein
VVLVAPERSVKFAPPSLLTCHCTVGAGPPSAVDEKETKVPLQTVWFVGLEVIDGAEFTVTVAVPLPVFEQFASLTLVTL